MRKASATLKNASSPEREQALRPRSLASAVPAPSTGCVSAVASVVSVSAALLALASPALLALGARQTLRLEVPELASLAAPCGGAPRWPWAGALARLVAWALATALVLVRRRLRVRVSVAAVRWREAGLCGFVSAINGFSGAGVVGGAGAKDEPETAPGGSRVGFPGSCVSLELCLGVAPRTVALEAAAELAITLACAGNLAFAALSSALSAALFAALSAALSAALELQTDACFGATSCGVFLKSRYQAQSPGVKCATSVTSLKIATILSWSSSVKGLRGFHHRARSCLWTLRAVRPGSICAPVAARLTRISNGL